jgi:hypothetical protein
MDPMTLGEHSFVVRNEGRAPLVFGTTRSTCNCTIGETPKDPIPPGEEGSIQVRWQTEQNKTHFRESATIGTNDPAMPELVLTIEGSVLVHVTAVPPELVLPSVRPDETPVATTTIASQVWDHFTVDAWESSLEGVQFDLVPASSDDLAKLEARAGYQLRVTLPGDLPQGDFQHWIRFRVDPLRPDATAQQYEIPLTGKVLRRMAVYGPGIDNTGRVRLGIVPAATGQHHRLLVKVRDPQPEISLRKVVAEPSFVGASLQPVTGVRSATGLYQLDISIPPNTTPCRFQGDRAGTLRLLFDHPRIPDLALRVDFAVADRDFAQTRTTFPQE